MIWSLVDLDDVDESLVHLDGLGLVGLVGPLDISPKVVLNNGVFGRGWVCSGMGWPDIIFHTQIYFPLLSNKDHRC